MLGKCNSVSAMNKHHCRPHPTWAEHINHTSLCPCGAVCASARVYINEMKVWHILYVCIDHMAEWSISNARFRFKCDSLDGRLSTSFIAHHTLALCSHHPTRALRMHPFLITVAWKWCAIPTLRTLLKAIKESARSLTHSHSLIFFFSFFFLLQRYSGLATALFPFDINAMGYSLFLCKRTWSILRCNISL